MMVHHGMTSQLISCVVFCGHCLLFPLFLIVMFAADHISFVTATASSHCGDVDDDGHVTEITITYIFLSAASLTTKRRPGPVLQCEHKM